MKGYMHGDVVHRLPQESSPWAEIRRSCEGEMKTGPGRKRRKIERGRERQKVTENRAELTWKKRRKRRSVVPL